MYPSPCARLVAGYTPIVALHTALKSLLEDTPAAPCLAGDFVAETRDHEDRAALVSSPLSATPYYWAEHAIHQGQLVHGPSVFDVVRRAQLPWSWNRETLSELAAFEHPLGTATIHTHVHRIGPGEVVRERSHPARIQRRQWFEPSTWFSHATQLGERYPRHVLSTLAPALLGFPVDSTARPLGRRPALAYWLRKSPWVRYAPLRRVMAEPQVRARVIETAGLDDLCPRGLRERAIEKGDVRLVMLLLGLSWACDLAADTRITTAASDRTPGTHARGGQLAEMSRVSGLDD